MVLKPWFEGITFAGGEFLDPIIVPAFETPQEHKDDRCGQQHFGERTAKKVPERLMLHDVRIIGKKCVLANIGDLNRPQLAVEHYLRLK